jgi:hypothetical protein
MKLRQRTFVVGEGITEQYYFKHLNTLKAYGITVKPRLFSDSSLFEIEKKTKELLSGGATVICVFDADVSQRNEKENALLERFVKKYKRNRNVIICDSLPAIEFWFLLHYKNTHKAYSSNAALKTELRKYILNYKKKKIFLENEKWVFELICKQVDAVSHARAIEFSGGSYSNLYKAIDYLEGQKATSI